MQRALLHSFERPTGTLHPHALCPLAFLWRHYRRLCELKAKFDPTNLFRVKANIPPG